MRCRCGGTSPGTIEFDLPPAVGGDAPLGTYPQIFAGHGHLDGTLIANIAVPATACTRPRSTRTSSMPDAATARSTSACTGCSGRLAAARASAASTTARTTSTSALTRAPFDEVPGLNGNGTAVGSGLECIYDVTLTGGFADMLGDLFLITDPVNYNTALNQLGGVGYANYLQSFPSLGVHYNDLFDHATNCEVPALAGSVLECRASAPLHVWGQLDYQWRKADGDSEAGR